MTGEQVTAPCACFYNDDCPHGQVSSRRILAITKGDVT